ncbi:cell filamentation protein Fic [Pseudomonas sp. FW215-R2]|uniref:Fic/DOC family protein n=1 Tax=unclassified Pseudomonas TaxID=196821 RepID=UPI000C88D395|nr:MULTISPECIES: Fic family protein [unclassified Pseudomonas]PMW95506.1 cell filamentation protein Fic [Pseudomonas sp. FW215-R2]PMX05833.1 cell filamentation protein Fic [Pseudomonas sp. FW215-L1]PMX19368.1 cell filamentation protein Fic [Pseudomonas sp. FW215-E1]PNA23928.1 cell filamentation protein Fic [Pseudomonas sp. FW215-R4]
MMFDPFGDFDTNGYLQNSLKLKDPLEVKESEHLAFEASLEDALSYLAKRKPIDYKSVLKTHEILFSGFYPWAGKDRNELVPHLAVFKGSKDDPRHTVFERPDLIRRSVEYALELAANKERFRERPGEVMGQLASAHPFLDGNGRTILLIYMELCYRTRFAIDWSNTNKDDYLRALSDEIQNPFKGHLDDYLKPYVLDISSRDEWPEMIGGIKGLDGLDKEGITYENLDSPEVQRLYKTYRTPPIE